MDHSNRKMSATEILNPSNGRGCKVSAYLPEKLFERITSESEAKMVSISTTLLTILRQHYSYSGRKSARDIEQAAARNRLDYLDILILESYKFRIVEVKTIVNEAYRVGVETSEILRRWIDATTTKAPNPLFKFENGQIGEIYDRTVKTCSAFVSRAHRSYWHGKQQKKTGRNQDE